MGKSIELTVEMLVAAAKSQLGLIDETVDQLRPIFSTQVQSINRLRAITVDMEVEPDMVFDPQSSHD